MTRPPCGSLETWHARVVGLRWRGEPRAGFLDEMAAAIREFLQSRTLRLRDKPRGDLGSRPLPTKRREDDDRSAHDDRPRYTLLARRFLQEGEARAPESRTASAIAAGIWRVAAHVDDRVGFDDRSSKRRRLETSRSPRTSVAQPATRSASIVPRSKSVTRWGAASAASTIWRPTKLVPPRISSCMTTRSAFDVPNLGARDPGLYNAARMAVPRESPMNRWTGLDPTLSQRWVYVFSAGVATLLAFDLHDPNRRQTEIALLETIVLAIQWWLAFARKR